jgi:integrase
MDHERWDYLQERAEKKRWSEQSHLINNMLRRFHTLCRKAGVPQYEIHDLRRSCITNWAQKGLPIHVTQQLAGHADIATTQQYYLAVQSSDFAAARTLQEEVVGGVSNVKVTDPKLTPAGRNREFSGRKLFVNPLKDAV